ncbi:MAG: NIL domain-containing protein [Chloroflexi bacterium]|nr:NIL domain-containing protein [Chloroflexota bacterium]MCL5074266.1 NIL domain-containing protein [Chloroflexota bacterium]
MAKRRVKFTFPKELVDQPLIYQIGRQFSVVTNIRRANVVQDEGWVILEMEGDEDSLEKAIEYARVQGVRVDPVEGDIIAG